MSWIRLSQSLVERPTRRPHVGAGARRWVCAASTALACSLLASCGGEPRLQPPSDSSQQLIKGAPDVAAGTPVSTAVVPQIGGVVWATSTDPVTNAPVEPVSSFRRDALRIIAAAHTAGLSPGASVEATWEYNDTSLDAFTTRLTPPERGTEQWISFYIERAPEVEWPVGTYVVKISLNGATVQQATVEVREE